MIPKLNLLVLRVWHRLKSEEGQDLIEYALLVGFISLAAIAGITSISTELSDIYNTIAKQLASA